MPFSYNPFMPQNFMDYLGQQQQQPMNWMTGPWGIGLTAASAASPVAASLLNRQYPQAGPPPGGGGLGMTKGLDPTWLSLYGRQLRPQFRSMLGQYLR